MRVRKTDKTLYASLAQRLHEELLEQADPKAVQEEAMRICSALEKQVLETDNRDAAETDRLHTAWIRIAEQASNSMQQRYQRVCERLLAPPPAAEQAPVEAAVEKVTQAVESPDAPVAEEQSPNANDAITRLAAEIAIYEAENAEHPNATSIAKMKQRLEKTWKNCDPPHPNDQLCYATALAALEKLEAGLEKQQLQNEAELGRAREMLLQLDTELEQGELHKALETRTSLQQMAKGHGKEQGMAKAQQQAELSAIASARTA